MKNTCSAVYLVMGSDARAVHSMSILCDHHPGLNLLKTKADDCQDNIC